MKIIIESIPHKDQRYDTVGDWYYEDDALIIRVSQECGNWQEQFLVAAHELVEVMLCRHDGVSQEEVDRFDMKYEEDRKKGIHGEDDEPGFSPLAPYRTQHLFASGIEQLIASKLGVVWEDYEKRVTALSQ